VYLPGIVLGALAVHRLGLKVADRLAEAGYATCIFDPPGIGESEGDFPAGTHEEVTNWVAERGQVRGTLDVVDWMRTNLGVERVALIGHCGGALTAIDCVADHEAVTGAMLISPPPLRLEKGKQEIERPEVADEYFTLYVRKLFDPEPWKKLLSGKSDYRTMATVARTKLRSLIRSKLGERPASRQEESGSDDDRFKPRLVDATIRSLKQKKRLNVVFGDKDIDLKNFQDFHQSHMAPHVPFVVIEDTSHGFTTQEGQTRLAEEVLQFAARLTD
jgi:pimeloyl-ACP methyl ester carboxylesterase